MELMFLIFVIMDLVFSIIDIIRLVVIQVEHPGELGWIEISIISTVLNAIILLCLIILINDNQMAKSILVLIWGGRLMILPTIKKILYVVFKKEDNE